MRSIAFVLVLLIFCSFSYAQPNLQLVQIASGFSSPVSIAHAGDGTNRLFVVEQGGRIKIVDDLATGNVRNTPFLNISSIVTSGGELGLLGLAFHPNYPDTPYFYVNYTRNTGSPWKTIVERYTVSSDSNIADSNSGVQIIEVNQPYSNHNAGDIRFGPDGYLYVTMGDGGSGEDPDSLSQNTQNLLGSILRLDVNGDDFPADPLKNYSIPPSNPFVGTPAVLDEFWAIGLRNPWRTSFDRMTGDYWIADVGQVTKEEINFQPAGVGGQNYGWSCKEGLVVQNFNMCIPGPLTDPILDYGRTDGTSITGGFVYRGNAFPLLKGLYIVADYNSGNFWTINSANFSEVNKVPLMTGISSFGESESGELYAVRLVGSLYRVFDTSVCPANLVIANHNNPVYAAEQMITSDVPVTSAQDVSYFARFIEINNPFEVGDQGRFQAEAIGCMARILRDLN